MSPVATISPVAPVAATPTPKLSNCTSEPVVNPPLKLTVDAVVANEDVEANEDDVELATVPSILVAST